MQPPVGYWDPLGLAKDGDVETFQRRRSVELKHGRIAMLAAMGYITPEARDVRRKKPREGRVAHGVTCGNMMRGKESRGFSREQRRGANVWEGGEKKNQQEVLRKWPSEGQMTVGDVGGEGNSRLPKKKQPKGLAAFQRTETCLDVWG